MRALWLPHAPSPLSAFAAASILDTPHSCLLAGSSSSSRPRPCLPRGAWDVLGALTAELKELRGPLDHPLLEVLGLLPASPGPPDTGFPGTWKTWVLPPSHQ